MTVALHEPGLQRVDDHRRRLIEAAAQFVHAEAEGGELPAREAAAHAETKPALGQIVQHRRLFGDPQRIVPGQDHRRRADIDVRTERGQVGHQLNVIRHERVIVEVVLGRPEAVEADFGGEPGQPDLLIPHAGVGAILPAVAGEHHHHADIHGVSLLFLFACSCWPSRRGRPGFHGPAAGARRTRRDWPGGIQMLIRNEITWCVGAKLMTVSTVPMDPPPHWHAVSRSRA